jgi:hypothetical protein
MLIASSAVPCGRAVVVGHGVVVGAPESRRRREPPQAANARTEQQSAVLATTRAEFPYAVVLKRPVSLA